MHLRPLRGHEQVEPELATLARDPDCVLGRDRCQRIPGRRDERCAYKSTTIRTGLRSSRCRRAGRARPRRPPAPPLSQASRGRRRGGASSRASSGRAPLRPRPDAPAVQAEVQSPADQAPTGSPSCSLPSRSSVRACHRRSATSSAYSHGRPPGRGGARPPQLRLELRQQQRGPATRCSQRAGAPSSGWRRRRRVGHSSPSASRNSGRARRSAGQFRAAAARGTTPASTSCRSRTGQKVWRRNLASSGTAPGASSSSDLELARRCAVPRSGRAPRRGRRSHSGVVER